MIAIPDPAPAGPMTQHQPLPDAEPERAAPTGTGLALWRWLLVAAVFFLTFAFRFLDPDFDNDHFRMMTQGRQVVLFGELPYRDFDDPGIFLQILTSAALQQVFGFNLLGQALFGSAILAAAAALTFLLATKASRSSLIALVVVLLAVAMNPRLKQHQVVFLPVLGLAVCWWYAAQPTVRRLVLLALVTALAFLLRHDQGVYVGIAAGATLLGSHWTAGLRTLFQRGLLYAAGVLLALAPFFIFLGLNGGVVGYFRSASDYVRSEAQRQGALEPPSFVFNAAAPLFAIEPPPAGRIKVRWADGTSAQTRTELERRHSLANPRRVDPDDSRSETWEYDLRDASERNIRRLVQERRVDDTHGLNRSTFQLETQPWSQLEQWLRAVPIFWVRIAPGLLQAVNAVPWLYHLFLMLPLLALFVLGWERFRGRPAPDRTPILALALVALAAQPAIRDPLADRLADSAAPVAILGAWLLGRWFQPVRFARSFRQPARGGGLASRLGSVGSAALRTVAALLVLGLTGASIASLPRVDGQLERLENSAPPVTPTAFAQRLSHVMANLQTSPVETAAGTSRGALRFADYVQSCTTPDDRLLVTWFAPDLYFYSGRGMAGRQLFWFQGYGSSDEEQRRALERLRQQSVPIIVNRIDRGNDVKQFLLVQDYIDSHYQVAWETDPSDGPGSSYRLLVDRRLAASGTYERLGLPCYRNRSA